MKTNKLFLSCAMSFLVTTPLWQSCEKFAIQEDQETGEVSDQVKITFQLFTPSSSRATSVADFKTVLVMDVVNDKVKQIVRQDVSTAQDFGSPTINLTPGIHTLRFFATDASHTEMSENLILQNPLGDSFFKSIELNTKDAISTQRVILERQIAKVVYLGENPAEINGVLTNMDLKSGMPVENPITSTLKTNEFLYTYIPLSGCLTLTNGTKVPVIKNQITQVNIDGSSGGGGEIPTPPTHDEMLVAETDTALIYVTANEINDVILSEIPQPHIYFAKQMGIYRMPTRREALILNKVVLPFEYWRGDRSLCYDNPADAGVTSSSNAKLGTGKYYTFEWGSGSVTTAGMKSTYSINPIRSVPISPISQSLSIDADFTWGTDTTVVK